MKEGEANSRQIGGTHYQTTSGLQHWDIVYQFKLDYFQGQIIKYVMRWKQKNGVQDLEKAAHFLQKYIELQKRVAPLEKGDDVIATRAIQDNVKAWVGGCRDSEPGRGYVDQG